MNRGKCLLSALLLGFWLWRLSRTLFLGSGFQCFNCVASSKIWLQLDEGFSRPGIYAFPANVSWMNITQSVPPGFPFNGSLEEERFHSGERLMICQGDKDTGKVRRSWMSAARRITLQIPLHPDCMTIADWEALPGLSTKLAERIEADRRQNGDFETLENLCRVPGIGQGLLRKLKPYFDVETAGGK